MNGMNTSVLARHVLRIGLGLTFVWMGLLIWQSPELYAAFLSPWAQQFVGDSAVTLKAVAAFDLVMGVLLISGLLTWVVALLVSVHLLGVLIGMGNLSDVAARDFGLLAASLCLLFWSWSRKVGSDQSGGR